MLGLVTILAKLAPVATPVIGAVLRGANAKGHAAGITTSVVGGTVGPLLDAIVSPIGNGFVAGVGPAAQDFGVSLGMFAATYVFGFAATWLTENKKKMPTPFSN